MNIYIDKNLKIVAKIKGIAMTTPIPKLSCNVSPLIMTVNPMMITGIKNIQNNIFESIL